MELTIKNIRKAIGLKEDLDYMIERFKEDGLGYVDIDELEGVRDNVKKDIENFQKKQETECPTLKEKAIIRISGGDGISYSQRDYYNITKIDTYHIYYDKITVIHGDYGNELCVEKEGKEKKEVWIEKYNRNYHKDNIPVKEWYELLEYAEKIPWSNSKDEN